MGIEFSKIYRNMSRSSVLNYCEMAYRQCWVSSCERIVKCSSFYNTKRQCSSQDFLGWNQGVSQSQDLGWREVVKEAEQIVGYPTTFLNLRWLLNDETANAAIQLRKLVGTNHPLLKSSKSNLQSVGLMILLVSKAAGFNADDYPRDHYDSGVLHAQRALAEIVEMLRTGHIIHKTMANLQDKEKQGDKFEDLLHGNKIVLLTGDYLQATCLKKLAGLRNNAVTELIFSGLRDLVDGDFLGDHDAENNPMPTQPKASNDIKRNYNWQSEDNLNKMGSIEYLGQGKDEWVLRTMLTSGSFLGKGCQAAMKIASRGEQMERDAYILGGHLALMWQLYLDVKDFFTRPYSYSLVGAPVILALWEYPTIYGHILEAKLEQKPIDLEQLYYAVRSTRAIEYLSNFLDDELSAIMMYSDKFPVDDARLALRKMAAAIHTEAMDYMDTYSSHDFSSWNLGHSQSQDLGWREVVTEAEQIVGYPTSFLNLRWLLNDEIANTAIHLRKLVGTNHPILKSAKNLLIGSKSNLQSVGLMILLVSKAAGFNADDYPRDHYDSGVLHAQRAVAEIVEMKRTGHIIHKTMANLQDKEKQGDKFKDLLYGNKIVLLTGDYLLATCLQKLGGLRNNGVTELISSGLRDLVEGDFLGDHDAENNPMPTQPKASNDIKSNYNWQSEDNLNKLGSNEYLGQGKDEWILRTMLTSGSILGKGCQAAMKIASRGEQMERDAYILGGHLALLWQLYLDVKDFFTHPYSYSLVGAPVILALWEYPTVYGHILEAKLEKKPIEFKQLYYAVRSTRAMEYLSNFLDDELSAIMMYSDKFPVDDARFALRKMAAAIHSEAMDYMET